FNNRQGAAHHGFRCDVSDHEAVTAAGKTPVGDQCHVLAQAPAHDGGGGREHLPHAGPALGAFVADHQYLAGPYRTVEDAIHDFLFRVEHPRRTVEPEPFLAGDLGHRAFWRQVATQDAQMAVGLDGVVEWANDVLLWRIVGYIGQILCQGLPGDGEAIAMQQTYGQEPLHKRLNTADGDQLRHHVTPARA